MVGVSLRKPQALAGVLGVVRSFPAQRRPEWRRRAVLDRKSRSRAARNMQPVASMSIRGILRSSRIHSNGRLQGWPMGWRGCGQAAGTADGRGSALQCLSPGPISGMSSRGPRANLAPSEAKSRPELDLRRAASSARYQEYAYHALVGFAQIRTGGENRLNLRCVALLIGPVPPPRNAMDAEAHAAANGNGTQHRQQPTLR
jgi:hypothetical protein